MRDLFAMTKGKHKGLWIHTAELLAAQANLNRDPKKRREPFSPDEFNPYSELNQSKAQADNDNDNDLTIEKEVWLRQTQDKRGSKHD